MARSGGSRLVAAMIGTAEQGRHIDLFRDVLGMEVVSEQILSGTEAGSLWGLPNRGIAGALCTVDDLDRVVSAAAPREVVTEPVVLGPWGRTKAATLVAPYGMTHTVVNVANSATY